MKSGDVEPIEERISLSELGEICQRYSSWNLAIWNKQRTSLSKLVEIWWYGAKQRTSLSKLDKIWRYGAKRRTSPSKWVLALWNRFKVLNPKPWNFTRLENCGMLKSRLSYFSCSGLMAATFCGAELQMLLTLFVTTRLLVACWKSRDIPTVVVDWISHSALSFAWDGACWVKIIVQDFLKSNVWALSLGYVLAISVSGNGIT